MVSIKLIKHNIFNKLFPLFKTLETQLKKSNKNLNTYAKNITLSQSIIFEFIMIMIMGLPKFDFLLPADKRATLFWAEINKGRIWS